MKTVYFCVAISIGLVIVAITQTMPTKSVPSVTQTPTVSSTQTLNIPTPGPKPAGDDGESNG